MGDFQQLSFSLFSLGAGICFSMEEARNSARVIAGAQESVGIDTSCWASLALADVSGVHFPLKSLCPPGDSVSVSAPLLSLCVVPQGKLHSTKRKKIKKGIYRG